MSKQIDFSQPLSEEDAEYVRQREWMIADAELSGFEVIFPETETTDAEESDDDESEEVESYDSLTVAELKAEIEARNEEKDEDEQIVPASSKKDDLIAALVADDEANPE